MKATDQSQPRQQPVNLLDIKALQRIFCLSRAGVYRHIVPKLTRIPVGPQTIRYSEAEAAALQAELMGGAA